MEKFPNELVLDITSHLSIKDKLNLVCVCKNLHDIISENNLYSKLVFEDEARLNQAMVLNDKKNVGHQIRQLCIGNVLYDEELLLTLPTLCPCL